MPGLTWFVIGCLVSSITLVFLLGAFFIGAEEKAYKKGFEDGMRKNRNEHCEFNKCKHYLTCKRDKGNTCEDFAACTTYMDAYDNDLGLWQQLHGWEEEEHG